MTMLHGAHCVGPHGRVIAFEPQPECSERIREAIRDNHITHVEVYAVGLSDLSTELPLNVLGGGTILATFAIDDEIDRPHLRAQIKVWVVTGDSMVLGRIVGDLVLKIDVEGYELHVLRGLAETIAKHRPAILTEIEPRYLRRAGIDEHMLFDFFRHRDYSAQIIGLRRRFLRYHLSLRRITWPQELAAEIDVVWLPAETKCYDIARYSE